MTYVPNPKRAEVWGNAIGAGRDVFVSIQDKTKKGFTRPHFLKIMMVVWPFFEQQLPEDVEDLHGKLEDYFDDFWDHYNDYVRSYKKEFQDDDYEEPSAQFFSWFGHVLDDHGLYDKLKDV